MKTPETSDAALPPHAQVTNKRREERYRETVRPREIARTGGAE